MKKSALISVFALFAFLLATSVCFAEAHGSRTDKKVGILLVAFGTSEASAQVAFDNIDRHVKAAFPQLPVRWAYTSHIIREKLAKQGKILDSPVTALARMMDENFTHVAVQSLHTMSGAEFHDLQRTIEGFKTMGGFDNILLGHPLMATQDDMQKVVDAVLASIPKTRNKNEAVVLMGHGTYHPANAFYAALMFQLQLKDPNIYVGTVEGYPEIDMIQTMMQSKDIKKAYLMPLMAVAGDHAKNDMAGEEADSWVSVLTKAGIKCEPILKGTAEYDVFADIWVEHLSDIVSHFYIKARCR